jgi:hypothetical protein
MKPKIPQKGRGELTQQINGTLNNIGSADENK